MRISQSLAIVSISIFLNACASSGQSPTRLCSNFLNRQDVIPTTNNEYPAKNPQTVALYQNNNSPHAPYRIIAMASVSRHNLLGMKRSDVEMQTMMKQLAANLGGDGLINMSNDPENLKAHVIAYQKILI